MPSKAEKLLERMRHSKANWKRKDIEALYRGFGFVIRHGANHDIVSHPAFPRLKRALPRHKQLLSVYVRFAVRDIDTLLELRKAEGTSGEENE